MTGKLSAGLLLFGRRKGGVRVLIAHMGGPFWAGRDAGGWSIPKGEYVEGEDPFAVACREFEEELGAPVPASSFVDLGSQRQASGKVVTVWAAEGEFDPATARSNTFQMEWPKGSGRLAEFPEVDRVDWFEVGDARSRLVKGQVVFLDRLLTMLETEVQP